MAETREVVQEKSVGVTPAGKHVVRQKVEVSSPEVEKEESVLVASRFIFYLAGIIEVLLAFRFLLKILGANPASWFVSFIYALSNPLESPFRMIFSPAATEGLETVSILEPSTVVALFVYPLVAFGVVELIKIITASKQD